MTNVKPDWQRMSEMQDDIDLLTKMRDSAYAEVEQLRKYLSDVLTVLNACRIVIKNRDQQPNEMKLLDDIKSVIAEIEQYFHPL